MRKYRPIIAWVVALALSLAIALVAGAALEPAAAVTPQRVSASGPTSLKFPTMCCNMPAATREIAA